MRESRRATVEDVEDEDDITEVSRFIEDFPRPVGLPHSWAPFETEDKWELGRWLMTSGVSLTKIDSFLFLVFRGSSAT